MGTRESKSQSTSRADEAEVEPIDTSATQERVGKLTDDVDDLLDDIDDVLETNAEEFVKSYVQKGGE